MTQTEKKQPKTAIRFLIDLDVCCIHVVLLSMERNQKYESVPYFDRVKSVRMKNTLNKT